MLKLECTPIHEKILKQRGNEQLLDELLEKLRLWLKQQLHLPQNISDRRLKYFIFATKFDFEKAKKRLDLYCSIHNWIPEVFDDFDPLNDSINQCLKYIQIMIMPKLIPEHYRLSFLKLINDDTTIFDCWAIIKYTLLIYEFRLKVNIIDNADVLVLDVKNLRMGHIKKITPTIVKNFDVIIEAYCIRVKNIYIINAPDYINILLKMVKTIMKAKLFQRIVVFTSGVESLYEKIPRSLFPSDYGGDQPSMDTLTKMCYASLVERRNWFLQQNELKTVESRRSESSIINLNDLFGISGTFRKLDID